MIEMEIMVFFPFEDVSEMSSDHAANEEIKGVDVQIAHSYFDQKIKNVILSGGSGSFCRDNKE